MGHANRVSPTSGGLEDPRSPPRQRRDSITEQSEASAAKGQAAKNLHWRRESLGSVLGAGGMAPMGGPSQSQGPWQGKTWPPPGQGGGQVLSAAASGAGGGPGPGPGTGGRGPQQGQQTPPQGMPSPSSGRGQVSPQAQQQQGMHGSGGSGGGQGQPGGRGGGLQGQQQGVGMQ
ncbi:unnamed protein product, partial [Sphacelaria rigidula]